ncbi:hypothetical protein NUU61_006536 [Penicillium alfredii]|uniref:Uncharacterized protein n=1 Tax=Penicillium alfredii TaxID=1506179 RepID=A0A9W9K3V5_9EURO|nr:uncharacterized protein NUU61_006536 [Penicillium alfredii]KAJ5091666.1 hypothetical protein NUU61_006536 [Penicillium alfredii]
MQLKTLFATAAFSVLAHAQGLGLGTLSTESSTSHTPAPSPSLAPDSTIELRNDDGTCNFYFNNVLKCNGDTSANGMGRFNTDTKECEQSDGMYHSDPSTRAVLCSFFAFSLSYKYDEFQLDPFFCGSALLLYYYKDSSDSGAKAGQLQFNNEHGDYIIDIGFKPTTVKAAGNLKSV